MQGRSNISRTEKANFKCHPVSLSPYKPSYMELGREENEKKIMVHLKDTIRKNFVNHCSFSTKNNLRTKLRTTVFYFFAMAVNSYKSSAIH